MTIDDLVRPLSGSAFDWPLFGLQSDVRPALVRAAAIRAPAALATLYSATGGAPMGLGAQMALVGESLSGFLSGGCVEADVALHAREVLSDGKPKRLVYGEGGPWDVRLPCGSRVEILIERITPDSEALQHLLDLTAARRPAFWLTDGERRYALGSDMAPQPPAPFARLAAQACKDAVCSWQSDPFSIFRAYAPSKRLVVVGANPIALALLKLSLEMGLETILIRPRGPKTCPLPVRYFRGDVIEALSTVGVDRWTGVAVLSHDAEVENRALASALMSEAGYIGALGSRRRMPERRLRLQSAGFNDRDLDRIHAPIGLPLGKKTAWSIALSVLAEVIGALTC